MNQILITICFLAGLAIVAQASPSLFKLPNSDTIEKLKEEFFGEQNFDNNDSQDQSQRQRHHTYFNTNNNNNDNSNNNNNDDDDNSNNNNGYNRRQHSQNVNNRGQSNNNNNDESNNNNSNNGNGNGQQNRNSRNQIFKDSSEDYSGEESQQPASVRNLKKDANKFADDIIQKLHAKIIDNGLNNIALPNDSREFRRKFYGITYHGEALLNHGYLKGFENIHRIGEASLHGHKNGTTSVVFETEFDNMEVGYSLEISFMMQKIPSQKVKGYLNDVTAQIEVLVDKNGKLTLNDFDITDVGHFKFQTTGLGSFNFLVDRIVETIGNVTKRVVLESVEGKIRLILNAILNDSVYPVNALFSSVQNELYTKFSNAFSRISG